MPIFFRRICVDVTRGSRQVRPKFRDIRFAAFLAGEMVNSIGGWASAIVLWGFAAYRFNASSYAVSITILCWAAPPALLSPVMGVYVDRLNPKNALLVGYLASAGAALGMAASGSLTELDFAAVAYGIARSLTGPAASALPPRIVASDDLLAANSMLGAAASTGQVVGPLAASLALALSGFRAAFVFDAASYLVGVLAILPLPLLAVPAQERSSWRCETIAGIVLVARSRALRFVVLISAAVTFSSGAFLVVEPLYARHVLHRPPSQFALFEAAAGAGAILAGLTIPRLRRLEGKKILAGGAIGYGLTACLFVGTTSVPVAYVGAFTWGVSGAVFYAVAITTLQEFAPVHAHGRIMGVTVTIGSAADTIALPSAGLALAVLGIRAGAIALAAVTIATGTICLAADAAQPTDGLSNGADEDKDSSPSSL